MGTMAYADVFRGARITQLGLGVLGRGVGDAAFLARSGAELIVTDLKDADALRTSLDTLAAFPNITYRLGIHDRADFHDRDLILKGAGVPLDSPYVAEARAHGVPVDMSASLVMRVTGLPSVGVTGTRGKSTVTALIEAMLRAAGRTTLLGGNVRGVSNLALLERVTADTIGVFELDSWQCQGLSEERTLAAPGVRQGPLSPSVAVFTTFMPDHQNYYRNDLVRYLEDKVHLFAYQDLSDTLVIGRQAYDALRPYRARMRAHTILADEATLPSGWRLALPGVHNRYNAGVALAAVRALGVEDRVSRAVLETFASLPGRLEYLRTVRGMPVYNDTNATTPEATAVALTALDPEGAGRIVLIAGGADKGLDLAPLVDAARAHARAIVLLPGTGTDRLHPFLAGCVVYDAPTLADALSRAYACAAPGDTVLFSPAFASFGLFLNEYDRGDRFVACVAAL